MPSKYQMSNALPAMREQMGRMHHRLGSSPIILFFLGVLTLLLWASASVVQIQTSEYLALGSANRVAGVAWQILIQPWLMISGQAPIALVTSWVYAWVVELVTLVFAFALSIAVAKIAVVNPFMAKMFVIAGGLLIILNGWADYSSSPGQNQLVQILIAVAIGGIVVVGLPLGIGLIEKGIEEL